MCAVYKYVENYYGNFNPLTNFGKTFGFLRKIG